MDFRKSFEEFRAMIITVILALPFAYFWNSVTEIKFDSPDITTLAGTYEILECTAYTRKSNKNITIKVKVGNEQMVLYGRKVKSLCSNLTKGYVDIVIQHVGVEILGLSVEQVEIVSLEQGLKYYNRFEFLWKLFICSLALLFFIRYLLRQNGLLKKFD